MPLVIQALARVTVIGVAIMPCAVNVLPSPGFPLAVHPVQRTRVPDRPGPGEFNLLIERGRLIRPQRLQSLEQLVGIPDLGLDPADQPAPVRVAHLGYTAACFCVAGHKSQRKRIIDRPPEPVTKGCDRAARL